MPDSILFVPECHVDTALTRTLIQDQRKLIVHKKGAPNVGNELHAQAERFGESRLVVGLVDADKDLFSITKVKPFTRLLEQCEETDCRFSIYQHRELAVQYLVVLEPACDGWIYGAAKSADLNPAAYSLPPTLAGFLTFTKKMQAEENSEIGALLKALRRSAPPAYAQLTTFVANRLLEVGLTAW